MTIPTSSIDQVIPGQQVAVILYSPKFAEER